nr:toxin-antitoxin system HicB family antitoxin [Clostridia bacterium]
MRKISIPADSFAYSGRIALRIPKSTHKKLAEKSASEGVSLNMLLNCAVERYISSEHFGK